ncbi:hypothetical protein [Listeria seeligeri]|uniref:hypothetical protein n=1 Tax=Listeria seeligeri TaxID=1640 RepID=UPI001627D443|nr:hypothetical protein [Listeria seeligeri]MBC1825351.1 hypothetical protein [Listeria seeligeri]MBC1839576.1 hypothetical protein [Listeria seeligeri]MBF2359841.1 hypothetical protein [Listeria seeligeri]MBF2497283.1 hypothetical protein [Listeria seeligeri]MBF2541380.1 hypothetical protein [Listeria seeligeri]
MIIVKKKRDFILGFLFLVIIITVICPVKTKAMDTHKWMAHLADDVRFEKLAIPGVRNNSNACKNEKITKQLNKGVRFFDLSLHCAEIEQTEESMAEIERFIQKNKSEFVLVVTNNNPVVKRFNSAYRLESHCKKIKINKLRGKILVVDSKEMMELKIHPYEKAKNNGWLYMLMANSILPKLNQSIMTRMNSKGVFMINNPCWKEVRKVINLNRDYKKPKRVIY